MSRYVPNHPHIDALLHAASVWKERCLVEDGSVLSDQQLWTAIALEELKRRFVDNPDASADTFQAKLQRQLADASPRACQLMAELLWVLNLFPSNVGPKAKREAVTQVWNWSGEALPPDHPMLDSGLLDGVGSGGVGFNINRWREVRFLLAVTFDAKRKSKDDRRKLVASAWDFAEWIDSVPDEGQRQLRLILPYLLFPDDFERIASPADIRRILMHYRRLSKAQVVAMTKVQRDRTLLEIRKELEAESGGPIDFYDRDVKSRWAPSDSTTTVTTAHAPAPGSSLARNETRSSLPPLNQILYGPPGTGKTFRTIDLALQILDPDFAIRNESDRDLLKSRFDQRVAEGRIRFVTFHQSFTYEDFVEGLRAEARADGSIRYYVADGVFKQLCSAKHVDRNDGAKVPASSAGAPDVGPRVLIIDEINRGNVAAIFGELITLIEPSKRAGSDESLSVMLPYSKEQFEVPNDVFIIGTMNTADRSLTSMDIALRRRFAFEEVEPDPSLLDGIEIASVDVGKLLEAMNSRIEALLDRDHRIGHAYFIQLSASNNVDGLKSVFQRQILPLLQEYFFEDWQKIRLVLNDHRKDDPTDRFIVERGGGSNALFGDGDLGAPTVRAWRINWPALDRPTAYLGTIGEAE